MFQTQERYLNTDTKDIEQNAQGITLRIDPNLSLRFYAKNNTNRIDVRTQGKTIPLTEEQWKSLRELHVTIDVCFTLLRDGPSSITLE